jgi:ferric-dicitrate binding protein FerR (iron transport regulator)
LLPQAASKAAAAMTASVERTDERASTEERDSANEAAVWDTDIRKPSVSGAARAEMDERNARLPRHAKRVAQAIRSPILA